MRVVSLSADKAGHNRKIEALMQLVTKVHADRTPQRFRVTLATIIVII